MKNTLVMVEFLDFILPFSRDVLDSRYLTTKHGMHLGRLPCTFFIQTDQQIGVKDFGFGLAPFGQGMTQ